MSTLKTNNIQHVDRSDPSIIINTDGSVNIAGTMTYEDVTNVDAVGIITGRSNIDAQKQVHVGTGVSIKSGGLNVTAGISTFGANIEIADKIRHNGDDNTAIRFPAADTFTIETAGTERARVDSSGDFGIGMSPSGVRLDVYSSSAADIARFSGPNSAGITIRNDTANELQLHTAPSDALIFGTNGENERMRITSDGKIGVGAASPSHLVHLQNATTPRLVVEDTTNNVQAQIGADNTEARIGTVSNHPVSFRVNDSTKLTIDTSGRLLINGTDANTVHTNADDVIIGNTSASLMGLSIVTGTSGYATLQFSDGGGAKNQGQIAYNHSNDSLILTANSESIMTIQSNGVVKVEKSDSSSFQAHFLVNNSESNSGISLIGSGSSFNEGGWAAVTDAGIIRSSANSSNGLVLQAASGDMRFYVAGSPTERMRITSGGALQFDSGYGEIKTAYGCRAWVDIDNTSGNMTLSGGGNVSSVTDLGGGAGRVNFSNNMPDTTYAVVSSLRRAGTYDMVNVGFANASSNFRYDSFNNGSSGNVDLQGYAFAVFR